MSQQSLLDPDYLNETGTEQHDPMNAILGAVASRRRRKAGPRRRLDPRKLARLRMLLALKRKRQAAQAKAPAAPPPPKRAAAKKPRLRSLWARLSPARRKAMVAAMIRKNPKLKGKLALALLKKRMEQRENGTITAPTGQPNALTPQASPAIVMNNPAAAPVSDTEQETPAEAAQDEMEESSLDTAANAEAAEEEGAEEAAAETQASAEANAEADAEEMSEETPEEAQEEAAEATDDAAEAVSESAGDLLLGYLKGKGKRHRRHHGHIRRCVNAAKGLAGEVERLSGGEIEAAHLLGAVKLIAKAKKGDVKAKKGIKALTKLAASKHPKAAKAKKATAKLKIAHAIMKKTGTAKGTTPKKKALARKKKAAPFTRKVVVRDAGLNSYSPYQRGMAMIPGFARAHFGTKE